MTSRSFSVVVVVICTAVALIWFGVGGGVDPNVFDKRTVLSPMGGEWRYSDGAEAQPSTWTHRDFDDGMWSKGNASFGYGSNTATTTVRGRDAADKPIVTCYFRRSFQVQRRDAVRGLRLHLVRDDGAVVYINGREVVRNNLPDGAVDHRTGALWEADTRADDRHYCVFLDPASLVEGENVVAVEVHQWVRGNTDMVFDLELVATTDLPYITRGPYLQLPTSNSIIVRWRTDTEAGSVVRFGTDPARLDQTVAVSGLAIDHEVQIRGLAAETRYFYAVADGDRVVGGGDDAHWFVTSPPVGKNVTTRIWAIGDSGLKIQDTFNVRDAYARHLGDARTDVWLMLGDNAYSHGTDAQYQAAVFETFHDKLRNTPVWSTLGNHDGYSAVSTTGEGPYFDIFTLPTRGEAGGLASGTEAYYSFDYGDVHFVCLESHQSDRSAEGAMLRWLKADLADTTARWIIAFWHHPPYTRGSHDSDEEIELIEMRENALPILEAGGVDLVLTGHSHSYERSFLIDGHYGKRTTLVPRMIKDKGDGRKGGDGAYRKRGIAKHEGAVYIVAGSSSHTSAGELDHPVMFTSLLRLGSLAIEVDGESMRVEFLDDKAEVLDHFSLVKG